VGAERGQPFEERPRHDLAALEVRDGRRARREEAESAVAVEMETAALYTIAARFRARALTVLTVSDHIKTGEHTTAEEREQTFGRMVEVALDAAIA